MAYCPASVLFGRFHMLNKLSRDGSGFLRKSFWLCCCVCLTQSVGACTAYRYHDVILLVEETPGVLIKSLRPEARGQPPVPLPEQLITTISRPPLVHDADIVIAGGPDAGSALTNGLSLSGIPTRLETGFTSPSTMPVAELPWQRWEIDAVAHANGQIASTDLQKFGDGLAPVLGLSERGVVGLLLLAGVREAADSQQESDRNWAQFVDALGSPGSLLSGPLDANREVTNLQLGMMLKRLASNMAAEIRKREQSSDKETHRLFESSQGLIRQIILPGCYYGSGQSEAAPDAVALGFSTAFNTLIRYVSTHNVSVPGTVGSLSTIFNITATLAKFIVIYSNLLNVDVAMIDGEPLVRTHDTQPGETKILRTTVAFSTGSLQFLSCLRIPLNEIGLDLDIPQNGAVQGALVQWSFVTGGMDSSQSKKWVAQNFTPILLGSPPASPERVIVEWARDASTSVAGGSIDYTSRSETNASGQAFIKVVGAGQKKEIPHTAAAVAKTFSVQVSVAVTQIRPLKALVNGLSVGLNVANGDVAGTATALVSAITDLIYGSRWKHSKVQKFALKDWGHSGYRFEKGGLLENVIYLRGHTSTSHLYVGPGIACPIDFGPISKDYWGQFSAKIVFSVDNYVEGLLTGMTVLKDGSPTFETQRGPNYNPAAVFVDNGVDPPSLRVVWSVGVPEIGMTNKGSSLIIPLTPSDDC